MISFASLDQQQRRLGKTQGKLSVDVQEHLLSNLLKYEVAKAEPNSKPVPSLVEQAAVSVVKLDKGLSRLSRDDLMNLHHIVTDSEPVCRQERVQPGSPAHQPLDPAIVSTAVDRFFEWVRSPSFEEIHVIEQMTLSQVRLYEIQPFQRLSNLTGSLFCLVFLLCGGYLIPLYLVEELDEFKQVLERALLFSTEDLVRFNLRACERSYEYALRNG
ncbi:MAG: hypothetical protein V3R94_02090 [Acidobacteriota bacterium]